MSEVVVSAQTHHVAHHEESTAKTLFGFWVYIMTDCVLFSILFATYAVLHNGTFGGPTSKELFSLPFALTETLILLTSSFTCGLVMLMAVKLKTSKTLLWLAVTFSLGALFLALELNEFQQLVLEGNSWQRSAFLSSYFTLVGTHGLHITIGLLWIIVMAAQIVRGGMTPIRLRRLTCFSLFWHFLDVVWIFIFTVVYLMGAQIA